MTESQVAYVNINRASFEELTSIRGIGLSLAQRIIDHRPYQDLHDLVRVPGINEIKLLTLLPFITLGRKKTKAALPETSAPTKTAGAAHVTKVGDTETFVFLEDRNERQDALLIIFGGFILGLIILMLRRSRR